jgi:pimeloyl-ACP methyl ester carboxylesterase
MTKTPPHLSATPSKAARQGIFWIEGDHVESEMGTLQRGPMFVQWMAPEVVTAKYPVVLVHGGGGQGTDWLSTPDGRPGWAFRLVEAGHAVYVVDRPGFGRSPAFPSLTGNRSGHTGLEFAAFLFATPGEETNQTQWPWGRDSKSPELGQLAAGMTSLFDDGAASQQLDGDRLGQLLEKTGPAIVITHSAGAPCGWLALNKKSNLVTAIVAVEPMGPPFLDFPGIPALSWGLTSAPVSLVPPVSSSSELAEGLKDHKIEGFEGAQILVLSGAASPRALGAGPLIVDFLTQAGAKATHLSLADKDIHGNAHGLIFEANSDQTIIPVLDWIKLLP